MESPAFLSNADILPSRLTGLDSLLRIIPNRVVRAPPTGAKLSSLRLRVNLWTGCGQ